MKNLWQSIKESRAFYSLIGLVVLVIVSSIIAPSFRTVNNMITIFRQASLLLILSSGLTAVLLTGTMDLSVGATAGFVGCVVAQLIKHDMNVAVATLIGLLIGVVIGLINGTLAGILPGFIATYGTNWVIAGLGIVVMQGAVIYDLPPEFTQLGVGYLGAIPNLVIFASIVVLILYILLTNTTLGRKIYQYGSNPVAAKYAAMPTRRVVLSAFVICSVCAAFAGMLMTARLNAADAAMGDTYGLQTVAAAVIGGTSQKGGEGGVLGTIAGALILTIVVNIMNLTGIPSQAQGLVIGSVIIIMVLIDTITRKRQESKMN
ncbi:MAG: ABC transporter permease [Solobacterium sp.]|nr:ABC transporter permease [Solobacterium sp.]